ncbi:restriction endonuclease subunit S [Stieleria sp. ICT_E10.1]|uniref:restriction endonuclease subunit S n=1 Tax=Stieleria sedimenti TaxID=2976331 RepID=UPI002180040E|nr:restriction endonuclease subunit S [Stieleria sedimenti]MCS7466413.1 restriction endonuclease subunit S [Stieleria sedimenti]
MIAAKWNRVPLPDAYVFQEGPGVRKWQFTSDGIKLLNVANIEKSGHLNLNKTDRHLATEEVENRYKHFLLDDGDLVIASSGISFDADGLLRTRGAFVSAEHLPLCLNTSTIRFKAKEDVSDLSFLRHWINGYEFRQQITQRVTGSAQQNFGPTHLKSLKISLPPLSEQKRIAEILDRAEALRSQRRAALALLDELTQSIFLDMFGDPKVNPRGWRCLPFSELFREKPNYGTMIPGVGERKRWLCMRVANIQNWHIDLSDQKFVDLPSNMISRHCVEPGDILLARAIATREQLGKAIVVPNGTQDWAFDSHLMRLRFDQEKVLPSFVRHTLMTNGGRSLFLRVTRRSAVQFNINTKEIAKLSIPVPPIEQQLKFQKRLTGLTELKQCLQESLDTIGSLLSSLQQRAFRGEL